MTKIDDFKIFVKNNPKLLNFVKKEEMTWQKFYEMYDIYGEQNEVWNQYLKDTTESADVASSGLGASQILNFLKTIDLDSVQNGVSSLQRVISVFQDFSNKDSSGNNIKGEYKPRPVYKHFED